MNGSSWTEEAALRAVGSPELAASVAGDQAVALARLRRPART